MTFLFKKYDILLEFRFRAPDSPYRIHYFFFQLWLSSDRYSGRSLSVYRKEHFTRKFFILREQGAMMRHNSIAVFRKSNWSFSLISIALKTRIRQDRGYIP